MINLNLDSVEEKSSNGFDRPGSGAYVLKVISAKDVPEKEYVLLLMDYAEGKFKGYGEETEARTGQDWGYVKGYLSYKQKALGILKHNIKTFDADYPGTYERFNKGDVSCLNGIFVCAVLGEQEYRKNDGTIGTKQTLPNFISSKDFRAGKFTIPALKKLQEEKAPEPTAAPMPSYDKAPF